MFERFTDGAREVVTQAQQEARSMGHGWIGTEHLLLGMMTAGGGVAADVLANAGVTQERVRAAVGRALGPGPLGDHDADALRSIGIDLDAVRTSVEQWFGPGALERARRPRGRRRRSRDRCVSAIGHIPFTPRAKKVLEHSLRQALALRHNYIESEHILLAVLAEGEGLAARILVDKDVSLPDLRHRVLRAIGKVA